MLVLNLPFKALMFLTLMRPSLVLFLVLWLKLVKDFLKVRCRLALLPFLISCLIWLDLVASLPRSEERFSRNAETDLVCRLLLEKKKLVKHGQFNAIVSTGHTVAAVAASVVILRTCP